MSITSSRMMRSARWWPVFALVWVGVGCAGGSASLPQLASGTLGDTTGLVARGEYITRSVAVCGHCHAADPRNSDGPLSGGFAFRDWRLGTIRAANLTPDSATGLGTWTDAEIVRAIRSGADLDGEVLAPIMPYEWFHGMSDHDALAVARYLRSQPPVRNVMRNRPNLVFEIARATFMHPEDDSDAQVAPLRAATAEYGRYLALSVGLCADCHTPRSGLRSEPDRDLLFAGSADPPKGFPANPSNLTPDSTAGIGSWTEQQFVSTMRKGVNPAGDSVHPFMPWRQMRRMTDTDLRAIFRYLRTVPAIQNRIPPRASPGEVNN